MLSHDGKNRMMNLTDAQGEILEQFILYDAETEGNIGKGMSSLDLAKRGIIRKTFSNNFEYLLDNYLIRLEQVEQHGKQIWKYFVVTTNGVSAYLKWTREKDNDKKITLTAKFFPLIAKYWKRLRRIYGRILDDQMLKAIDQIGVQPQIVMHRKGTREKFPSDEIMEVITLPLGGIEVKLIRNISKPRIYKNSGLINYRDTYDFGLDNITNIDTEREISNSLTFVLFYNLINLSKD